MADVYHCKECGREFTNGGVGATRGFYGHDYCSEGCRAAAEKRQSEESLRKWREKGKKKLAKLEKETEKLRKRIDALSHAMNGDDPGAIEKAITGGFLKLAGGRLVLCLKLIGLWAIFKFGYVTGEASQRARANNAAGESAGAAVESVVNTNANSTAIDMQKQKREEQLLERRRELLQPAGEDGNTSAPVAEQE